MTILVALAVVHPCVVLLFSVLYWNIFPLKTLMFLDNILGFIILLSAAVSLD